ncbi:MAG: carbamoyltransferase [Hyphomicrobiaceae bacterium]|nr:MAG: carbamoyltransferase [Hyphomicrobiaceae bacterium]
MQVLGISAFYHDSAAALVRDGRIVAAAQEERFTRVKHDKRFPEQAIAYCLKEAGLTLDEIDHIVFYEKPLVKFERLIETYLANAPRGFRSFRQAMPLWIKDKLFQKAGIVKALEPYSRKGGIGSKLLFAGHHQSHAASAYFPSPFDEAVVLTLDGVGEWSTSSVSIGRGHTLTLDREIRFPHSLGLLYSAFAYYTGFKVNSGEYKVMGLAPYGEPRYAGLILDHILDLKADGSFWLDQDYFDYATGLTMTSERFHRLFGGPPRNPDREPLTQRHMDLAASVQKVTEEVMLRMSRELSGCYGIKNLCLAGGVALNCVANGKILREGRFEKIYVQPAAGDAGGALGAALAAYHVHLDRPRLIHAGMDGMQGSYLGPEYSQPEIERRLKTAGARYATLGEDGMLERTVDQIVAGDAVGWFQGRMEFGPRALGARSILGDPRNPAMQRTLNLKIKYRESFRPFAPAVLAEDVADYFELDEASPYMLLVADVKRNRRRRLSEAEERLFGIDKLNTVRSDVPAVTHVDYSARIQTVHKETNPRFHRLIDAFKKRTGCSVLVNTSFNVRGEPIVATPEDAFRCFMGSEMETLVVGNCVLRKGQQDRALARDYKSAFAPD